MATPTEFVIKQNRQSGKKSLSVQVASGDAEVRRCQQLRHDVFSGELKATLHSLVPGLDVDEYDAYCKHLMVIDNDSDEVVATTRILTSEGANNSGGFYSESEFYIDNVLDLNRNIMEVGRTCVHADYRKGAALALLWQGVLRMAEISKIDFLIGCASIPLSYGESYLSALMERMRKDYYAPEAYRVKPRIPMEWQDVPAADSIIIPALLRAYLRQGFFICGEPYLDTSFNVADVFILLDMDNLNEKYFKHFLTRD